MIIEVTEQDNKELTEAVNELEDELTANGKRIYLDYKDGKYGYNTDAKRGADTFNPFSTKAVLLWTNPNVGAMFLAQAINLDLSKYKAVIISNNYATNDQAFMGYGYFVVGYENWTPLGCVNQKTTVLSSFARQVLVSATKVEISDNVDWSGNVYNQRNIPYKIYGVPVNVVENM